MRGVWASWGLVAPGAGNPRALVHPNLAFWRLGVQQRPDSGGVRPTDRSQSGAACVRARCSTEAEIEESIVDWAGPLPLSRARRSRTSDASAISPVTRCWRPPLNHARPSSWNTPTDFSASAPSRSARPNERRSSATCRRTPRSSRLEARAHAVGRLTNATCARFGRCDSDRRTGKLTTRRRFFTRSFWPFSKMGKRPLLLARDRQQRVDYGPSFIPNTGVRRNVCCPQTHQS